MLSDHRREHIAAQIDQHLAHVERLIAVLDRADGDCDREDDDPAGDPLDERGEAPADDGRGILVTLPLYDADQRRGPINRGSANRAWLRSMEG